VVSNFPDPSHQKIFPWEHGNVENIARHNSLGIFCWGSSLKIQREIKREVFLRVRKGQVTSGEVLWTGMSTQAIIYYALRNSVKCSITGSTGRPARIPLVRDLQKSPPFVHKCNALLPGYYPTLKHNFQQKEGTLLHFILTSGACAVRPSVTMLSTDFSFQNLVFGNLFEFSVAKITLKSIPPTL
jgi:hypothetical protein